MLRRKGSLGEDNKIKLKKEKRKKDMSNEEFYFSYIFIVFFPSHLISDVTNDD